MNNISSHFAQKIKGVSKKILIISLALVVGQFGLLSAGHVSAATTAVETVTADPLPAPTLDKMGVVFKQVIVGDMVYAVGNFSSATDLDGKTYPRLNILAYNIRTGRLNTTFNPSLRAEPNANRAIKIASAMAVTPNGRYLIIGGSERLIGATSNVNGKITTTNSDIVIIDLSVPQGRVVPTSVKLWNDSGKTSHGSITAITASNNRIVFGGIFSYVDSTPRKNIASFKFNSESSIPLDAAWNTSFNGERVGAMTLVPGTDKLVVGGGFYSVTQGGVTYPRYSNAAISFSTGKVVNPWASSSASYPVPQQSPQLGKYEATITAMQSDANNVYMTGQVLTSAVRPGTFEGRAAISTKDGSLVWLDDCLGDSYDIALVGGVLYSASHAHQCVTQGGWNENNYGRKKYQHALAETTYRTGYITDPNLNIKNSPDRRGTSTNSFYHWYPRFTPAIQAEGTGQQQATWSVTGNNDFISYGGEFTAVQHGNSYMIQRGLVRFAKPALALKKAGPVMYESARPAVGSLPADSRGVSLVSFASTYDPDDATLNYTVYRLVNGNSVAVNATPISISGTDWNRQIRTLSVSGLPVGTIGQYKVVATDKNGNIVDSGYMSLRKSPIELGYDHAWLATKNLVGIPAGSNDIVAANGRYRNLVDPTTKAHKGYGFWSPSTGVSFLPSGYHVTKQYIETGGINAHGFPTSNLKRGRFTSDYYFDTSSGRTFYFNNTVYNQLGKPASSYNTTFVVEGSIKAKWNSMGASYGSVAKSPLGRESQSPNRRGSYQYFYHTNHTKAIIVNTKATGKSYYSYSYMLQGWLNRGAETGKYGYPTSDPYYSTTNRRYILQRFEGGTLTWDTATNKVY